jgi:hypothetical protein
LREQDAVVYVAQVGAAFDLALDKVIECVEIDIGPELGREVANRQATRAIDRKQIVAGEIDHSIFFGLDAHAADVVDALFKQDQPPAERPAPGHKQVFARLDGKAAAIQRWASWAARRDGSHIRDRVALTEGSEPLQKQVQAKLSGFTRVLDILHVDDYRWKTGTALYGETEPKRAEWVEAQLLDILSSHADLVIQRLEDKAHAVRKGSQAGKVFQPVAITITVV